MNPEQSPIPHLSLRPAAGSEEDKDHPMHRHNNTLILGVRRCGRCHGSGKQPAVTTCPECGGSGSTVRSHPRYCISCGGVGVRFSRLETVTCVPCGGTGTEQENTHTVVTPAVWHSLPIAVTHDAGVVESLDQVTLIATTRVKELPRDPLPIAHCVRHSLLATVAQLTRCEHREGCPSLRLADGLLVLVRSSSSYDVYAYWGNLPVDGAEISMLNSSFSHSRPNRRQRDEARVDPDRPHPAQGGSAPDANLLHH